MFIDEFDKPAGLLTWTKNRHLHVCFFGAFIVLVLFSLNAAIYFCNSDVLKW